MQIEGYEYDYDNGKDKTAKKHSKKNKTTSAKKVFVTMLNEFEAIYLICTKVFMLKYNVLPDTTKKNIQPLIKKFILEHSYYIFFNGVKFYSKEKDKYIENDTSGFLILVLSGLLVLVSILNLLR